MYSVLYFCAFLICDLKLIKVLTNTLFFFSKTLDLVKSRVKHNRIAITLNPGLIFKITLNLGFLLNLVFIFLWFQLKSRIFSVEYIAPYYENTNTIEVIQIETLPNPSIVKIVLKARITKLFRSRFKNHSTLVLVTPRF